MNGDTVKYCAYIQNWNGVSNVEENVLSIEQEFIKYKQNYKIINSSNTIYDKKNWINVGDIWYFRSFYQALKNFDFSNDYFLFITGDFKAKDWKFIFDRSIDVLSSYSPTSFSFYYEGGFFDSDKISIGNFEKDIFLEYSALQDGVFVFYHRDIAKILLEYFEYINNLGILDNLKYGWGIDVISSALCYYKNGFMLKDKRNVGINSSSGIVGGQDSTKEMEIIFENFISFCNINNFNCISFFNKVKKRVGIDYPVTQFTLDEFYAK